MRETVSGLVVLVILLAQSVAQAAAINDVVDASQEAFVHHTQREGLKRYFALSFSESFQGPGVNNLDGHLTTSAPPNPAGTTQQAGLRQSGGGGHHRRDQAPPPGSPPGTSTAAATPSGPTVQGPSLRHSISAGYHFNETFTVGPVFEMSEKLYGPTSGTLKWGDPQVRLSISNVVKAPVGAYIFSLSMWLSAAVPVSDQSKNAHTVSAVGFSLLPRLHIPHSDFSLSGTVSAKPSITQSDQGEGVLLPTRVFSGIQVNYRVSRVVSSYVMNYISGTIGPQIATPDADLTADASRGAGAGRKIGIMPGLMIRAADFISVSPRLNWNYGQPLQSTTVGVSANITMI